MKKKASFAYTLLLAIVLSADAFGLRFAVYLIPLYLVAAPLALGEKINMGISARQAALTAAVSVSVLLPFLYVFLQGRSFSLPAPGTLAAQLFGVSFPEEVFFRGFIQETAGNNFRGIVLTSLLFAAAHLPAFFWGGDHYALLTFFPSLIMGFLYMKTSSVMPPTIFHFLANVVYLGSL